MNFCDVLCRNTKPDKSEKAVDQRSVLKRRSFVKSLGTGTVESALLGSSVSPVGAVSDDRSPEDEFSTEQRAFDPLWYSPVDHYWKGTTRTEASGEEYEGAILLRGNLTLNENS